jgi:hypothetical protein
MNQKVPVTFVTYTGHCICRFVVFLFQSKGRILWSEGTESDSI